MSDNILEALKESALETPGRTALISPRGNLTIEELERRSSALAQGLSQLRLRESDRTVLMVTPGADFLVSAFGILKHGCSMVLVDPGIGLDNVGTCLAEAEPAAFIGVPLAHLARKWRGWAKESIRITISTGLRWGLAEYSLKKVEADGLALAPADTPRRLPDHCVATAFTSGSTGPCKGVVFTQQMFEAQVRMLRDAYSIQPGEVDLATFPLFGLFDVGWKATTVFPDMDYSKPGSVDPEMIVRTIQDHQVTHMFGSPALLDRVSRYAAPLGARLPSLRRVLSAGAPVSTEVLERFRQLLTEGADVHTPYGATEALPVTTIEAARVLAQKGAVQGRGVCVGSPLAGLELQIIPITDEPIAEWNDTRSLEVGEVGEITVSGDNVSRTYCNRPEANRLAKIRDGKQVWHRMGDLGYLDEEGRVWFCGRKVHRVETGNQTLYSVQVEGIYNQHPAVFRSALVGIGKPGAQKPVLCVQLEEDTRDKGGPELIAEILALGEGFPFGHLIDTVLCHEAFPVDIRHNAKIFREKLAAWAEAKLSLVTGTRDG